MHFNNETEMNHCPNLNNRTNNLSTSKNCSTSSTDSGVILIDNAAAFKSEIKPTTKDNHNTSNTNNNNNNNNSSSSSNEEDEPTKAKSQTEVKSPHISIEQSHTVNIKKVKGNKKISPTLSIRSNTISIVSIDENAIDSSCIDSDSEIDGEGIHDDYTVQKLGQQISYPPNSGDLKQHLPPGVTLISRQVTPTTQTPLTPPSTQSAGVVAKQLLNGQLNVASTTAAAAAASGGPSAEIGHVAVNNSTDVTFGDKHFYEGPVTIQQFLIDNRDKWKPVDGETGQDNPAYNGGGATANGDAKLNAPAQVPLLCPYLPSTISRKAITITVIFVLLTIILGIILATTTNIFGKTLNKSKIVVGDGDDSRQNIPINSTIDATLILVNVTSWGGKPSKTVLTDLKPPVHRVIISHTAGEDCSSMTVCSDRVRIVQSFHMDGWKWDDIAYNFLIGGDGRVYVGRGWDKLGAHTKGYNKDSLGISFIGTFTNIQPTEIQLAACQLLLAEGVRLKKLVPDYRLYAHRQLSATESPGEQLFKIIQKWPHWSHEIPTS